MVGSSDQRLCPLAEADANAPLKPFLQPRRSPPLPQQLHLNPSGNDLRFFFFRINQAMEFPLVLHPDIAFVVGFQNTGMPPAFVLHWMTPVEILLALNIRQNSRPFLRRRRAVVLIIRVAWRAHGLRAFMRSGRRAIRYPVLRPVASGPAPQQLQISRG